MAQTSTTPARKSGGEYLNHDLPSEMLAEIGKYLDLNSKLKLRLVLMKARQGDVLDMLKESLRIVYVSPTRISLRNFKQICSSTFFQQHIVEVVFMPKALDIYGEYMGPHESQTEYNSVWTEFALDRLELEKSWQIYQNLVYEHWWSADDDDDDEDIKKTLTAGLRNLSNMETAAVSLMSLRAGINRSTVWLHKDENEKRKLEGLHTIWQHETSARAATVLCDGMREQSVQDFYDALWHSGRQPQNMRFGDSNDGEVHFEVEPLSVRNQPQLAQAITSGLKKLRISCADSSSIGIMYSNGRVGVYWWERLASNTPGLEELETYTGHRSSPASFFEERDGCKVIDHFLRHGKHPRLRKLTVQGPKREEPSIVESGLLVDFLTRHAATLEHVVLNDILITAGTELSPLQVYETYKRLMSLRLPALQTFKVSIYRVPEHIEDDCWCCNDPYRCQYYYVPHGRCHVSVFSYMARNFDLELRDERWDFGEIVMRSIGEF